VGRYILKELLCRRQQSLIEPRFESTAIFMAVLKEDTQLVQLLCSGDFVFNECVLPFGTLDNALGAALNGFFFDQCVEAYCWRSQHIICSPLVAVAMISGKRSQSWKLLADILLNLGYLPDYGSLVIAIATGCRELVDRFLEAGADVNSEDTSIDTPLQRAARLQDISLVARLLKKGACVNAPPCTVSYYRIKGQNSRPPRTALQAAVETGNPELIQLILDAGADINAPAAPTMGATALQIAAINGHLGIAKYLVERGADIDADAGEEHGRTALEGAAENGRIDMIHFLLHEGARTTGKYRLQYLRAIRFAERQCHHTAANLLRGFREGTIEDEELQKSLPRML